MSAVERAVPRVDVLLPSKIVEDVSVNLSRDNDELAGCFNRRLSRVSRLRDMFQTGVIRPVEEIDSSFDQIEPSGECPRDTHNHFLRTFPGSPPLSALRNHRARAAQQPESLEHRQGNSTPSHSTAQSPSCTSPGVPNRSVPTSLSTVTPPARPPKPRNLTLDSSLPSKPPPTLPKAYIPSEPKNSVAASDRCANTQASAVSSGSSNIFSAHLNDTTDLAKQISFDRSIDTTVSSVCVSASEVATLVATVAPSQVLTINTSDTSLLTSNHLASPASSVASNAEPAYKPLEHCSTSNGIEGATLSSWQCSTTLDRISPAVDDVPCYQNFILHPEAFCKSPQSLSETTTTSENLPGLQLAEPVAVGSFDEDDSEEIGADHTLTSLPVPAGLKVLAVDSNGVHILEDGNFFYAVEGLSSRPESPVDSSLLKLHSRGSVLPCVAEDHPADMDDISTETNPTSDQALADSSNDSFGKRVRFSTEPIMVYSTHSTSEYNRRNEDINPLAASAEYELEKQLEDMEFFDVELLKSPTGLGISILGLGVDNIGGDQKLSIFIKSLTPGGAAEANGQIQVFDQIVEVDGINLVGVSQQFAAQTLRNTREVVHFVLARERNPTNGRVAQLLAEQEEEDERQNRSLESWHSFQSPKSYTPDLMDQDTTFPFDGSAETFLRPLTDTEQTTRTSVDSMSDADDSGEGEDEEAKFSVCSKVDDDNPGPFFTTNPLFTPDTDHAASQTPSDQNGSMESSKPPSVLKGTATAASTKRRQDAVLRLIRVAQQRLEADRTSSEPSSGLRSTDPAVDPTAWILANELHDCHTQLTKLQSRVQHLEQRLTAQEAAADEAIERLCLQRQHVMLELNESRERLKQCNTTHNNHCSSNGASPSGSPLLNGGFPAANSSSLFDDSYANSYMDLSASPANSSVEANASDSDPTGTPQAHIVQSTNDLVPIQTLPLPSVSGSDAPLTFTAHTPKCTPVHTSFGNYFDSPNRRGPTASPYLNHAYRRVRLTTSGGLARRRPPTRLTITPAPGSLLETTSHLLNECSVLPTAAPSASSSATMSSASDRSAALVDDGAVCSQHITPSCSPSRPCVVVNQDTANTGHPEQTHPKILGVQLPGLSDGTAASIALHHRHRDSPPSAVDDCTKEGFSLASPERRISRI